jgi:DNA-binding transcriptional ArsR family regulator
MSVVSVGLGVKLRELVRRLAEELILRERGSQVPTVAELAKKFDVGHGTVQRALRILEEMGAVRLEARGHLGTYILDRDVRRLWEVAGMAVLLGGLPVPVNPRVRALANHLRRELSQAGVRAELAYVEGSRSRLGQVRAKRLDFAVVSRFAAERAWQNQRDIVVARAFGAKTYCDPDAFRLAYKRRKVEKIGVDWRSCEHYWRTAEAFSNSEHLFVKIPYLEIPEALKRGEVDVALWDEETIWPLDREGLTLKPVEPSPIDEAISEACVVVLAENRVVYEVFAGAGKQG